MSFTHRIDERTGILHCALQGRMALADFLAVLDVIAPDGVFCCTHRLYDMRGCLPDVTTPDVQMVAAESARRDRPGSRVALVSDADLTYGMPRQYEGFRKDIDSEVRVFRSVGPALAWLERAD